MVYARLVLLIQAQKNSCFWVLTERVTQAKCYSSSQASLNIMSLGLSVMGAALNYAHACTHQMSTQCSGLSQTSCLYLRRDTINMKHPNSQLHSSTSFSLLVDFLWVSFCSESVNTAALAAPHGESPELLY